MAGYFGGRDLCNRIWTPQTRNTTVVGNKQTQNNTAAIPSGALVGDLALVYGCVNTSSTSSGTLAIASAPTGWTSLSGAGVAQISTTPTFTTRGIWWKVLTLADLNTGTVTYGLGTLAVSSATGIMVFRGASTFTLLSSGGVSGTAVNQSQPVASAGAKLYINLLCLRADLAEVITPPTGWVNAYPGVMFAGAFFFADPTTYNGTMAGVVGHWSWTTSSGGFNHYLKAS